MEFIGASVSRDCMRRESFIRVGVVMVSLHCSKTVTKVEVDTRYWDISVIGFTMVLF